jgi:hypothetical protein
MLVPQGRDVAPLNSIVGSSSSLNSGKFGHADVRITIQREGNDIEN